jgi:hypothetical protein
MREIRQSGSEGGGAETNRPSLPLSKGFAVTYAAERSLIDSDPLINYLLILNVDWSRD